MPAPASPADETAGSDTCMPLEQGREPRFGGRRSGRNQLQRSHVLVRKPMMPGTVQGVDSRDQVKTVRLAKSHSRRDGNS